MTSVLEQYRDVQGIVIKGPNWVGDTIISFPAVHSLYTLFPQARIYVLTKSHLAELWEANPDIDEVIPYEMPRGISRIFGELKIARLLKDRGLDLALILPRSFSSAWMAFLGGISYRIGYGGEARDWLLTERVERDPQLLQQHRMYYYLHLLEKVGDCAPPPLPQLSLNGALQGWAGEFLAQRGLKDRLLIGFNPGATYGEAKCWPLERFVTLGRRLIAEYGASVIIFSSPDPREMELNAAIAQGIGDGCVNLSGETSLLQLASVLRHCRLLVTNDTGTMHVAAAVGSPVVAIFGPTDPRTTSPLGEGHVIVRREVPCSPCLKRVCPEGHHQCMRQITVEGVFKEVDRILQR